MIRRRIFSRWARPKYEARQGVGVKIDRPNLPACRARCATSASARHAVPDRQFWPHRIHRLRALDRSRFAHVLRIPVEPRLPDDKANVLPLYTEIAALAARAAGLGRPR
jgi:hypothetical protein